MRISQWVEDNYGFDGWWTALQFDSAVSYLGSWVESEVQERMIDKKQKPEDVLRELLGDNKVDLDTQITRLALLTGGVIQR
jgi:hypothetical protein